MRQDTIRIMALALVSRGVGVAVMDQSGNAVDWRVKEIHEPPKRKNARCVFETNKLIEGYRPQILVLEDPHAPGAKKRKRTTELFEALKELAIDSGVGVVAYGPRELRATFELARGANKDQLAAAVAKHLPILRRRLPKPRRLWESEQYVMPIFIAFALTLTHVSRAQRKDGLRQ